MHKQKILYNRHTALATRYILTMCLLLFISSVAYNQSTNWTPERREVEVEGIDSTIRAYISIENVTIKTKDHLTYYWYDNEHINNNMGGYDGLLLDGYYTVYNNQDKLITKGMFLNGLKEGQWKYWNARGVLIKSMRYKQGQLHGISTIYDHEGTLINEVRYRNGMQREPIIAKVRSLFTRDTVETTDESDVSQEQDITE